MTLTLTDLPDDRPIYIDTDEGHVHLVVMTEKHETFCVSPVRPRDAAFVERLPELVATYIDDPESTGLVPPGYFEALLIEYRALLKATEEQTERIDRTLTPADARALAAALTHCAAEVER